MSASLPVAIIGAGHLGTFHARALGRIQQDQPTWIVDIDAQKAASLAAEVEARAATDLEDVLARVKAVIVATPTETHFEVAAAALRAGCHVLVEKPMTQSVPEGEELVALAAKCGRKLQVGHIERFNPVFLAARKQIGVPAFVEAQRLAPFVPRSLDVDVVLDLMIHDLDILLSLVPYELESLDAVGVAVLTPAEDIASAWLRFSNGTVASLTASRVSPEKVRKIRFFGKAGYLSLDLLRRSGRQAAVRRDDRGPIELPGVGRISVADEPLAPEAEDALLEEIRAFLDAIANDEVPRVSGADGLRVQRIAARVQAEVRRSLQQFGASELASCRAGAGIADRAHAREG